MTEFRDRVRRNQWWDYSSPGAYFITICTKNSINYLGRISEDIDLISKNKVELSEIGKIARKNWEKIPVHYPFVRLDEFVIMPNHLHGILFVTEQDNSVESVGTQDFASVQNGQKKIGVQDLDSIGQNKNKFGPQSKNLASIIRGYKASVKSYATKNNIEFAWHTRYHDRVIRNMGEYNRIRSYIKENPSNV